MREVFSRVDDGEVVTIEVALDVSEHKEESPYLFSLFVKYDGFDEAQESYEEYLETKESLIIALANQNAHYLGCRVADGWSEFYFCASDAKNLNHTAKEILCESGYIYESNVVKDKKWNFYETQLFPTELELSHIQSEKIIFLLKEEGDSLDVVREVEHYIVFDTPTQKAKFLHSVEQLGFKFKDDLENEEFEHGVAVTKEHAIDSKSVEAVVSELFAEAQKVQGYYEGWSTLLANKED